jgi:tetratricopeptide (TPR) repeat protein
VLEEPASPPRLRSPQAPAPLEAVCLKALAKDPNARYPNVHEFRREIERFLADEPVLAAPESWSSRSARSLRKRPALAVGIAVFLTATAVAGGLGAWATDRQRRRADENYMIARNAVDDYTAAVRTDANLQAESKAALLKMLAPLHERLAAQVDPAKADGDQAERLATSARVHMDLGRLSDAERDLRRAEETLIRLSAQRGADGETSQRLLDVRADLARVLSHGSRPPQATAVFQAIIAETEAASNARPDDVIRLRRLVRVHSDFAVHLKGLFDDSGAVEQFERAVGGARRLLAVSPHDPSAESLLAAALHNWGGLLVKRSDFVGAKKLIDESSRIYEARRRAEPDSTLARLELANSRQHQAKIAEGLNDAKAARAYAAEAFNEFAKLAEGRPGDRRIQLGLAEAGSVFGELLVALRDMVEGERVLRVVLAALDRLIADAPEMADYHSQRVVARLALSNAVESLRGPDEAIALGRAAFADVQKVIDAGRGNPLAERDAGAALLSTVPRLTRLRRHNEAIAEARKGLAFMESCASKRSGDDQTRIEVVNGLSTLAAAQEAAGDVDESRKAKRRAYEIARPLYDRCPKVPSVRRQFIVAANNFGMALVRTGLAGEAIGPLMDNLSACEAWLREGGVAPWIVDSTFYAVNNLELALSRLGRTKELAAHFDRIEPLIPPDQRWRITCKRIGLIVQSTPPAEARTRLAPIEKSPDPIGAVHYDLACAWAKLASRETDASLKQKDLESSLALLTSILESPYLSAPANVEHLKKDRDLDAVRQLPAYAEFVKKLDAKAKAASLPKPGTGTSPGKAAGP